jgi:hypothetical protein
MIPISVHPTLQRNNQEAKGNGRLRGSPEQRQMITVQRTVSESAIKEQRFSIRFKEAGQKANTRTMAETV